MALPDGRVQIVTYHADENGYHADVRYEGDPIPYQPAKEPVRPSVPVHRALGPFGDSADLVLPPDEPLLLHPTGGLVDPGAAKSLGLPSRKKSTIPLFVGPHVASYAEKRRAGPEPVVYKPKPDPYKAKLAKS